MGWKPREIYLLKYCCPCNYIPLAYILKRKHTTKKWHFSSCPYVKWSLGIWNLASPVHAPNPFRSGNITKLWLRDVLDSSLLLPHSSPLWVWLECKTRFSTYFRLVDDDPSLDWPSRTATIFAEIGPFCFYFGYFAHSFAFHNSDSSNTFLLFTELLFQYCFTVFLHRPWASLRLL